MTNISVYRLAERRRAQLSLRLALSESPESSPGTCIENTEDKQIDRSSARQLCRLGSAESMSMIQRSEAEAYAEYVKGTPCLRRLPTVLSLNVFHALARNATSLGVSKEWMVYEAISPFCQQGPDWAPVVTAATPVSFLCCPDTLRPTELQKAVAHHPWIDLFPLPRMRDNVLKAILRLEAIDEDELCYDLVDVDDSGLSEKASLIIWGDAWDPRAWEVTEKFIRKWGWLLEGCSEMLEATNNWRQKRGEKPLLVQLPMGQDSFYITGVP